MKIQVTPSWCLFLDRDGVINERIMGDYVKTIDEFKFRPGVLVALEKLNTLFQYVFVVTNQQGIGKGIMSATQLLEVHDYMESQVRQSNGRITKVYFAPDKASPTNNLRKPEPGMALQAQREFDGVNFHQSIMVGDTDSDILFGSRLGMKTVRIKTDDEPIGVEADYTINGLLELIELLEYERN